MNELLIGYCVFSYLFMCGVCVSLWGKYPDYHDGVISALIMSPIIMPVFIGISVAEGI